MSLTQFLNRCYTQTGIGCKVARLQGRKAAVSHIRILQFATRRFPYFHRRTFVRKSFVWLILLLAVIGLMIAPGAAAQSEQDSVVRAVLFYSPTCPHCHEVINKLLIPMIDKYGDRLQILAVNVTESQGQQLYQVAVEHYNIPPERLGVPTLVVDDMVLVGSGEIPARFPQIVEDGLAGAGIDWPGIPGLTPPQPQQPAPPTEPAADPTAAQAAPTPPESATAAPKPDPTAVLEVNAPGNNLSHETVSVEAENAAPLPDPVGISLAGLVLGAMLVALIFTVIVIIRRGGGLFQAENSTDGLAKGWSIPLLALAGLGVAAYLAYVEINQVEAVCGPVGNCNAVQSSSYAEILGIPVAVLGILNYAAILGLWLTYRYAADPLAELAMLGLLILTFVGTLFSVYLTVLEIFVIQAVCAWCISSAIITTAIMLIVAMSMRLNSPHRAVAA